MPPRDSELPEGTDHIINGAMETGAGTGASTGSSAAGGTGGGSSSGFIGAGSAAGTDDTGGTASGIATGGDTGGSATGRIADQVRDQVQGLKSQATDKVRQFADQGKDRATTALDNFNQVVQDAARSVDERLGSEYGQYAHRAADAVSALADGLRGKSVDDLLEDSRALIRKSPGVAIGAAALIGFALARVVKAGLPEKEETDIEFTPDRRLGSRSGGVATGNRTAGTGV